MSTIPTYDDPLMPPEMPAPRRLSALAVTSLVLVLIAWCPVVGLLGPLLGLIALILILINPAVKGLPLAIAGIVLGLGLQVALWVGVGRIFEEAVERPREFMVAVQDRDWTAVRATSAGDAAAASEEAMIAFADALDARYGRFTEWEPVPPPPGTQPDPATGLYPFAFLVRTADGSEATISFDMLIADEATGSILWRPAAVTVTDADGTVIAFPPPAPESGIPAVVAPEVPADPGASETPPDAGGS